MDQSGRNNTGTLANTAWAGAGAGKFGNALSFNGTSSAVTIADSNSLDLTGGMTLEAWVKPAVTMSAYRTVVVKEQPGNLVYGLYANSDTNRPEAQVTVTSPRLLAGTTQLPAGSWSHLAATYDGTTERLYLNGTQISTLAISGSILTSTGNLKIGGNSIWGEWFNGLIDEVRVYNRALSAAEIGADMNSSISSPDTTPPSAPGTLTATGGLGQINLTWGAATDNVGVSKYDLYRGTSPGFTPTTSNRIAQPTTTNYTDTSLPAGTYYYKTAAEDAAGNTGPLSNEATATTGDTAPPSAPGSLNVTGAIGQASLTWGAATDNVGVVRYDVYRSTISGFTPSAANRIAQPTTTSYIDTVAPGSYYYRVAAEDAAQNIGPTSNEAAAIVSSDVSPPTAPSGLAAAVTGSTATLTWAASSDNVGVVRYNVHRGTSSGFVPSAANRIAQPTGLTYADTGLTIGAYYYKVTAEDAAGNVSVASNEAVATIADTTPPSAPTNLAASVAGGSVSLTWTAATDNVGIARYDVHRGTTPAFVPAVGNRIAQPTTTGYTDSGVGPGTYYYKVIAEDAAGNVSLASNTASATIADTTPPTVPVGLGATGGAGQATLSWTASTDDVGVLRYNVHRSTTSGFTPSAANRIAQPTSPSYTDVGVAAAPTTTRSPPRMQPGTSAPGRTRRRRR